MKNITSAKEAADKINRFLSAQTKSIEIRFPDGFFLKVKKHIKQEKLFLEIHTAGYDDTLPAKEAVDWISWELIDDVANGILTA